MIPAILGALRAGSASSMMGGIEGLLGGIGSLGQKKGEPPGLPGQRGAWEDFQANARKAAVSLNPVTKLMASFDVVTSSLKGTLLGIPNKILEIKQTIVSTAQTFTQALAAPITTIKELGDSIGQFVKLANPTSLKMFNYRVENAFATIGNIVQPIFDSLSNAAITVGDTFAKIKPALKPAMEAVSMLIDVVVERFGDIAESVAPAVKVMADNFRTLAAGFAVIERPITQLIRYLNSLRASLFNLTGTSTGFAKDSKADVAVHEPRYSSTYDIYKESAKNSLMASMSEGQKKPSTPEGWLELIHRFLEGNLSFDKLKQLIQLLKDMIPDVPGAPGSGKSGSSWGMPALDLFNMLRTES